MKTFYKSDNSTIYWVDADQPRAKQVLSFLERHCEDITELWYSGTDMLIMTGILSKDLPETIKHGVNLVESGNSLWYSYDEASNIPDGFNEG